MLKKVPSRKRHQAIARKLSLVQGWNPFELCESHSYQFILPKVTEASTKKLCFGMLTNLMDSTKKIKENTHIWRLRSLANELLELIEKYNLT